jgi:hypothetical protein
MIEDKLDEFLKTKTGKLVKIMLAIAIGIAVGVFLRGHGL